MGGSSRSLGCGWGLHEEGIWALLPNGNLLNAALCTCFLPLPSLLLYQCFLRSPPHINYLRSYLCLCVCCWQRSLGGGDLSLTLELDLGNVRLLPCAWNVHSAHYPTAGAIFKGTTLQGQRVVETMGMVYVTEPVCVPSTGLEDLMHT